ncbi:MAG: ADP-ribosylglycohydrolase family protein [Actinomycetota bacterium]|nr:ADP-ribosylglycohydrolase family protein [Actinomycetota bacterium]
MGAIDLRDRAEGCLLGACIGDAWGAPYEFKGPRPAPDGYERGVFGTEAGHPTDDSTLMLFLAEHLAEVIDVHGGKAPDPDEVTWDGYTRRLVAWVDGRPPDVGNATRYAAGCWRRGTGPAPDDSVQGNGSLMAVAACGVAWASRPDEAARAGSAFADLTHPSRVARQVNADAAALLAHLVAGLPVPDDPRFRPSLPCPPTEKIGWCKIAWALAVDSYHQAQTLGPLDALRSVIGQGGDTDTNGTVAGAVLGAAYGTRAWAGWPKDGLAEATRCRRLAGQLVDGPP